MCLLVLATSEASDQGVMGVYGCTIACRFQNFTIGDSVRECSLREREGEGRGLVCQYGVGGLRCFSV